MTATPVAYRSNPGKYNFIGTTQLVNCYAEKMGADAKGPLAVVPCDGLVEFATNGDTPCRGLIYLPDLDKLYDIRSSAAYKNISDGTSTRIGTVPGADIVQLSRNQNASPQIVVQADAGLQYIATDSLAYILDSDVASDTVTCDYVSGYHIFGKANRQFFTSSLNAATAADSLDFATFEQRAGKLLRVQESAGELVGLCSEWIEFWRNGTGDFPFSPIGFKSRGLKAKNAVAQSDNTLFFVGDDNNVYRIDNYNPVVVSTHEIARLIQEDDNPDDLVMFSYEREGHAFLTLSGTDWTREYDSATGVWHSRKSYGQDRWRAIHSAKAPSWGKTIVGDRLSGKSFYLSKDTFTEDGNIMEWKVISPPMHAFPNGGIIDALHFDVATGVGVLSGQGSDPKMMLRISKDGGNTFDQYRELELGVRGAHTTRVTARRLGKFGPQGAVIELSITDPVIRALVNTDAEVRPLKL